MAANLQMSASSLNKITKKSRPWRGQGPAPQESIPFPGFPSSQMGLNMLGCFPGML